jgi:hypothetical protein
MIFILIIALLSGCSQNSVPLEEYQRVVKEKEELEQALLEKDEYIDVRVYGEFTATVRSFIPSYTLDYWTPLVAVLTIFQSGPFTVQMTEELISELDVGKTYRFKIEDRILDENYQITTSILERGTPSIEVLFSEYNLTIESFREPQENELGLESVNLYWERLN